MKTKVIQLPEACFFHARPAGSFAAAAKKYKSMVMVTVGTEFADGKNAIALMRLGRLMGRPFELLADGPDEEQAVAELEQKLQQIFFLE